MLTAAVIRQKLNQRTRELGNGFAVAAKLLRLETSWFWSDSTSGIIINTIQDQHIIQRIRCISIGMYLVEFASAVA